jgi:hypothetical protein
MKQNEKKGENRVPALKRNEKITPEQWKRIRIERSEAQRKQLDGIASNEIHKLSVEAKLKEAGASGKWFDNFVRCERETIFIGCYGCGKTTARLYRCNSRWCPCCNWRITERRKKLLERITAGMTNVKHIVLTQRNFPELSQFKIREANANLTKLRRRRITSKVHGGCASLEFTNEDTGWHLHWHILAHTIFCCANCLAYEWGQLVKQDFAVVKVLPVDDQSYLKEVCKYVVEGSELAKWTPEKILQLVDSLRRTRTFTTFGSFRETAKHARAVIELEKPPREICECGCANIFVANSEDEAQAKYESQFE